MANVRAIAEGLKSVIVGQAHRSLHKARNRITHNHEGRREVLGAGAYTEPQIEEVKKAQGEDSGRANVYEEVDIDELACWWADATTPTHAAEADETAGPKIAKEAKSEEKSEVTVESGVVKRTKPESTEITVNSEAKAEITIAKEAKSEAKPEVTVESAEPDSGRQSQPLKQGHWEGYRQGLRQGLPCAARGEARAEARVGECAKEIPGISPRRQTMQRWQNVRWRWQSDVKSEAKSEIMNAQEAKSEARPEITVQSDPKSNSSCACSPTYTCSVACAMAKARVMRIAKNTVERTMPESTVVEKAEHEAKFGIIVDEAKSEANEINAVEHFVKEERSESTVNSEAKPDITTAKEAKSEVKPEVTVESDVGKEENLRAR